MGSFRAKDADRDRFIELIEAAYVDGQLGAADRELRVGRALSAETLDELETLTRDLQLPPGYVPPAAPSTSPSTSPSRSRRATGVLVGLVMFVVLVVAGVTGIVALAMFAVPGENDSATSQGVETAPAPIESEEIVAEVPEAPSFAMSAPQVRAFVRAYEEEFGTLEAFEVGFYPERVGVQVPVRGSRPRMERWSWTGEWRQDTTATTVRGPYQRVDLGAVDVGRLFDNIAAARRTLEVEKGRFTHALLIRWGDEPTELNIYVGNEFSESGYLSSTPAGEIMRRHPYES
ncbi:DUF1707 SHOCT-like domain-containing protein [Nocardioides zhouii]|uniref:DUF1707 domain-containing protein n=1 Tax=Nocardioides zhouii TaxID=1168729 RepID=A0A4Q2SN81_9ACTN|nr:DUF1707 domain-containing protein [Nocardioides zhouii]RYC07206.1 DUF1707 domain-containing protein [Nocardioides zhouii]